MKSIVVLLALCSVSAFAAPTTSITKSTATVDVHNLACVQRASTGIYTDLRATSRSIFLGSDQAKAIELVHNEASADGCDITKLKQIDDAARMGFGFLHNIPLTIAKSVYGPYVSGKKCVEELIETVTLDLGNGVVLTSESSDVKPATGCP